MNRKSSLWPIAIFLSILCWLSTAPAMAVGLARERGFKLNEQTAREESEQILGVWNAGLEKLLQGDGSAGAQAAASYILVGLAANKQQPNKTTDAIAHYLIGRQSADGRWPAHINRPPSESSDFAVTALPARALQLYAPTGLRREAQNRIERARQWLTAADPRTNEDQAFQLLGLAWANADKQTLQKMARGLLARQRKDGGWGQHPTLESDAYATGKEDDEYEMGRRYRLNLLYLKSLEGNCSEDTDIQRTMKIRYNINLSDEALSAFVGYLIELDPYYPSWSQRGFLEAPTPDGKEKKRHYLLVRPEPYYQAYLEFQAKKTNPK